VKCLVPSKGGQSPGMEGRHLTRLMSRPAERLCPR